MAEWLASIMPNVVDYSGKFWSSCLATGQMFLIAGGFTLVFGSVFGVLLTVTRKGGILENALVYGLVNTLTNVFRSIPFVILLIFLIPLTRMIVGTAIGVKGAIVPLVFGAVPFFTRQVEAALANVAPGKVEAAAARVRDIDPEIRLNLYQCFYLPETRNQFDFSAYDYVVDCIDTVTAKLDLVMQCRAVGTPIVCALGTGNKLDPTRLELSDISKTSVCPLARVMRKELRRRGVEHLKVVWSREEPIPPRFQPEPEAEAPQDPNDPEAFGNKRRGIPGSSPFVPPAAGLILASAVVRDLLKSEK